MGIRMRINNPFRFAIAIPARYGSSRFPGKPLAKIAGKTMVERVLDTARKAARMCGDYGIDIFVTTEDTRISDHVQHDLGADCIITSPDCKTGSDRVLAALEHLDKQPDFILNLQGDAPFTPVNVIEAILKTFILAPETQVATPVYRLGWEELDLLREAKNRTPYSGTTVSVNAENKAMWFSKNIIPAIRNEQQLRADSTYSPVLQHIGLYGFRRDILERFCSLDEGVYERLEGLEQLRMLENGISISAVEIKAGQGVIRSGVDSPQDLKRAEEYIAKYGEIV